MNFLEINSGNKLLVFEDVSDLASPFTEELNLKGPLFGVNVVNSCFHRKSVLLGGLATLPEDRFGRLRWQAHGQIDEDSDFA